MSLKGSSELDVSRDGAGDLGGGEGGLNVADSRVYECVVVD